MCLAQGPQCSYAGKAPTRVPSVSKYCYLDESIRGPPMGLKKRKRQQICEKIDLSMIFY